MEFETMAPEWRQKSIAMFPELVPRLEGVESPSDLWVELWLAFADAYDHTPRDESLIRRIYRYSRWCCEQPGVLQQPEEGRNSQEMKDLHVV